MLNTHILDIFSDPRYARYSVLYSCPDERDPVPLRGGSTEHPGGGERPGARVRIGTKAGSRWGAAEDAVGDRERVTTYVRARAQAMYL